MLNPVEDSQTVIPAFIAKLWHMVSDSTSDNLISWGQDGTTFVIKDHNKFSSEMLPMYYKHNNMASFIRQLNMYNFHKVLLVDSSSLKNQKELEFSHPNFVKDYPSLLSKIQRKIHSKEQSHVKCDPVVFNSLLKEVKQLRAIQEMFSTKLTVMKKENAALWREHSILRQRHVKQEKIVNKVIHFLISMVQQSSVNVSRRKGPLMIKDRPILKPAHRKKYVKGSNQKNHPVISEITPEEMLKEANGQLIGEEVLQEELLLPYNESEDAEDEEATISGSDRKRQQTSKRQATSTKAGSTSSQKRKVSSKKMKVGKKRKFDETKLSNLNNEFILSTIEEALSPSSSFAESIPSPECILIDNGNGVVKFVQASSQQNSSFNNTNILQESSAQQQDQIPQIQVIDIDQFGSGYSLIPSNGQTVKEEETLPNNILAASPQPTVTSPAPSSVSSPPPVQTVADIVAGTSVEPSQQSTEGLGQVQDNTLLQLAKPTDIHETIRNKEDAELHLDRVQSDLDMLKDLLKSEGISLDANMVLELFNDNPIDLNMGPAGESTGQQLFSAQGDQALMSYSPSLLDLESDFPPDTEELCKLEDDTDTMLYTPKIRSQSPPIFPDPK